MVTDDDVRQTVRLCRALLGDGSSPARDGEPQGADGDDA